MLFDVGIGHDTVCAGVVCAATSGTARVEHENEAIHNDKSRNDHDDESPCWNALAGNAIVMMKASIDTVSE